MLDSEVSGWSDTTPRLLLLDLSFCHLTFQRLLLKIMRTELRMEPLGQWLDYERVPETNVFSFV